MLGQSLRMCLCLLPEEFPELAVASGKRPCREGGPGTRREAAEMGQVGALVGALFLPTSLTLPPHVGVTPSLSLSHTENSVHTYTKSHLVFPQILW